MPSQKTPKPRRRYRTLTGRRERRVRKLRYGLRLRERELQAYSSQPTTPSYGAPHLEFSRGPAEPSAGPVCTSKEETFCKAYVKTLGEEEIITQYKLDQNHEKCDSLNDNAKRVVLEDVCVRPLKIIRNKIKMSDHGKVTTERENIPTRIETNEEFQEPIKNLQTNKEPPPKMLEACRTCLKLIDLDNSSFYKIEADNKQLWTESCRHKLLSLIPEMRLNITPKPMLCADCYFSLKAMFEFRARCLKTESVITQYLHANCGVDIENLDLKDVSEFDKSRVGNAKISSGKLVQVVIEDFIVKDADETTKKTQFNKNNEFKKNTEFNKNNTEFNKNTKDEFVQGLDDEEVELSETDITIVKHEIDDFTSESVEVVHPNDTVLEPRNDKIPTNNQSNIKRAVAKCHNRLIEPKLVCKICGIFYCFESGFKRHMRRHIDREEVQEYVDVAVDGTHEISVTKCRNSLVEPKLECKVCGVFYGLEHSFKRHMRRHINRGEVLETVTVITEYTDDSEIM